MVVYTLDGYMSKYMCVYAHALDVVYAYRSICVHNTIHICL